MGPAMPPAPLEERPISSPTQPPADPAPSDTSDDEDDFGPSLPSTDPEPPSKTTTTPSPPPPSATETASAKPQRDEWMTMAPTADGLASRMDPSRPRPTKFNTGKSARTGAAAGAGDGSAWHETPEQKQKRLADEVMGVSKAVAGPRAGAEVKGKTGIEEGKGTGKRGESLVEKFQRTKGREAEVDDPSGRAFDREKDMASGVVAGEKGRREVLRRAGEFSGKFQGGGYL
ncbi:hypothetical protein MBLNU230_g3773t2 [Neophaeotheca triangularis]